MASTHLSHLMSLIDYTTLSLIAEIKANGFHQLGTVKVEMERMDFRLPNHTYKPMVTINREHKDILSIKCIV